MNPIRLPITRFLPTALAGALLFFGHAAQAAQRRIALVMGVWQYDTPGLPNLPGIEDDIKRFAAGLKKLGFEVEASSNPTMSEAKNAIDQFGEKLKQPDTVGLFYFSGHGSEHGGENYLIPRKANLKTTADLGEEAVAANRVIHRMEESGSGINLMFLDCCRCPIKTTSKSADGGFAQMKASGVFIGYATASEKEANASTDGSIYTNALLKYMVQPGLSINDMHTKVTGEVEKVTAELGVKQTPFQYSGLNNLFYMVPDGATPPAPIVPTPPPVIPGNPPAPAPVPPAPPVAGKGPWMFSDSSRRYLTRADVAGFSTDDLWRARNEIYARNGYIFSSGKGQVLVRALGNAYRGTTTDQIAVSNSFNQYESANVDMLKKLELGGGAPGPVPGPYSPGPGPYTPATPPAQASAWLFPDSSTRRLTKADLSGLNASQLWRARNEIYARKGYIFSKAEGKALARSLGSEYSPKTANADAVEASFNKVEQANVNLIKSLE